MIPLLKIISKNFKLLTRSKISSLIIILGPLLLIFLVGIAFDTTNTYDVRIGVYSEKYNNVTTSFIDKISQNNFHVQKYESEEKCIDNIKTGKTHACVIFPPDMQFKTGITNEITFYVDYSEINIVWLVLDTISTHLSATESEVSQQLTEVILSKLQDTQQKIGEKKKTITELKTTINELKTTITKTKEDLDKLDLTINPQNFKITEITNDNNQYKEKIYLLKTETEPKIITIINELNETKTKVSRLNISLELQTPIQDKLQIVNGNVSIIGYKINMTINQTDILWTGLNEKINSLQQNVNMLSTNLDLATKTRQTSSVTIETMKQTMDQSINTLDSIEQTFNQIEQNMATIPVTSAKEIANPITTKIKPITKEKTQLNYLFPTLIVLVIMFISILLSTTIIMMEKHSPAHIRNFITPVDDITFVLGTFFTTMILVITQLIIILSISSIFFETQILSNLTMIFGLLLIITALFTFLGMIVGHLFDNEETATLAAVSLGTIFLLLSGTIIPIETMPDYVNSIAQNNPFVISTDMLRKAIVFNPPIETLQSGIRTLLFYVIIFFTLTFILQKNYRRNFIHSLTRMKKEFIIKNKKK